MMTRDWPARFRDRAEAGRQLADRLAAMALDRPVVLALPRGGVPVAAEIAHRLAAPLDLLLVRKIGAPGQPELAIGAVANGEKPVTVLNDEIVALTGATAADIAEGVREGLAEIRRRRALYLAGRQQPEVRDRIAVVVDDGIATGATMRAGLQALRHRRPARIVLAVPVAPPDTVSMLAGVADEVVCLVEDDLPCGIGGHYRDFHQLEDAEVIALLDEAARRADRKDER